MVYDEENQSRKVLARDRKATSKRQNVDRGGEMKATDFARKTRPGAISNSRPPHQLRLGVCCSFPSFDSADNDMASLSDETLRKVN